MRREDRENTSDEDPEDTSRWKMLRESGYAEVYKMYSKTSSVGRHYEYLEKFIPLQKFLLARLDIISIILEWQDTIC